MTYFNGSYNDANVGRLIAQAIDGNITAEPGISRVTANIVSSTLTWNVYKSAAANNEKGVDFYFAIGYPTTTSNSIVFTVMEEWNTTSNLASNFAPNVAGCVPAANYANPRAATNLPAGSSCMAYLQSANLHAVQAWGVSATANRVCIFTSNGTVPQNLGFYLGLYDPFLNSTDDPFPLICCTLSSGAISAAALSGTPVSIPGFSTREPKTTTGVSANFGVATGAVANGNWTTAVGSAADLYLGNSYMSRQIIYGRTTAGIRGLLKDCYTGPSQTANGDTITWTLNGTTYNAVRAASTSFGLYFLSA